MLDKFKLIKELEINLPIIQAQANSELNLAKEIFNKVKSDPDIANKLGLKTFFGQKFHESFSVNSYANPYNIVSVDGSQIYLDRHQNVNCYLINIGICNFNYSTIVSSVKFETFPKLFIKDLEITNDKIDLQRLELELKFGLEKALEFKQQNIPFICLFDGSLIFWQLESKDKYLKKYLDILSLFNKNNIPVFSYISFTKSRDFIGCLNKLANTSLDNIVDADLFVDILPLNSISAIFSSESNILKYYSQEIKICFCYINIGLEIARIEFPFYMTHNFDNLRNYISIILDQITKGNGYPISLSEAHEQAVVKSADKALFYDLIAQKYGQNYSQKSLKKRVIAV